MKKLLTILIAVTMIASASASCTVDLVEKNPSNWSKISGGNYGTLTYTLDGSGTLTYNFAVMDSDTLSGDHTLVVIEPELAGVSEWPKTGSMALSGLSGSADISALLGNIDDGADYDGSVYGVKIWYVPTADFDGSKFTAWNPANILFEEELIVPCDEPTPAPEFSSLAIALAALLSTPAFAYLLVNKRN
ncbi:MAG: hypothetical protein B6U97_04990 [Candidatus Altiarchaeales archaeon ex4484_96]|nr:MAG: hypothetical protein B6U97_04990 [Candidatus Altiarchaeales archaeon ex4484_96]